MMQIEFVTTLPKDIKKLRRVEMDTGICFLNNEDQGFRTYGVSSCIVFVGYLNGRLLFMTHLSTPESTATAKEAMQFITDFFNQLLKKCQPYVGPLLEIYAIGGQESSLNTVNALRAFAKTKTKIKIHTNFLHLVHHEDYFNLYLPRDSKTFYLIHRPVFPYYQILEDLQKRKDHPAPLLYALAFVASNQPSIRSSHPCKPKLTKKKMP